MLCLKRKLGEKIKIGDDVTVVILEVSCGSVKLGITAPKTMPVDREEISIRKKTEGKLSEIGVYHSISHSRDTYKDPLED